MPEPFETHDVVNQVPPFADGNLYASDRVLRQAVTQNGGEAGESTLLALGAKAGSGEAAEWARLANEIAPILRTHDAQGRRRDVVEFHPAYHALMETSFAAGAHRTDAGPGAHVIRAAKLYLAAEMEPGHCCPVTMTHAAQSVLARAGSPAAPWLEKAQAGSYDKRFLPMERKTSVTLGMGMTEKQGGSDVRANTTRAEPLGQAGPGAAYRITGHKWFMSAPMSDAFLVLAQARGRPHLLSAAALSPDGSVNRISFQRLKAKARQPLECILRSRVPRCLCGGA